MLTAQQVVARILEIHPAPKKVTLYSSKPGEALPVGVEWDIIRKNADKEMLMMAGAQIGANHRLFQFLQTTQTTPPSFQNTIRDWEGGDWIVAHIDYSMGDRIYDCLCLKNVG
jgi:hypothetical protein